MLKNLKRRIVIKWTKRAKFRLLLKEENQTEAGTWWGINDAVQVQHFSTDCRYDRKNSLGRDTMLPVYDMAPFCLCRRGRRLLGVWGLHAVPLLTADFNYHADTDIAPGRQHCTDEIGEQS